MSPAAVREVAAVLLGGTRERGAENWRPLHDLQMSLDVFTVSRCNGDADVRHRAGALRRRRDLWPGWSEADVAHGIELALELVKRAAKPPSARRPVDPELRRRRREFVQAVLRHASERGAEPLPAELVAAAASLLPATSSRARRDLAGLDCCSTLLRYGDHPMTAKTQGIRSVAFHEAGHAVVAIRFGILLSGACTIVPDYDEGTAGFVETAGLGFPENDEEHAVMLYAGHAAELLHNPMAPLEGARDDYQRAAEIVPDLGQQKAAQDRAAVLVSQERQTIEAVVHAMIQRGTLHGDEVQVVVDAVDCGEQWEPALAQYLELKGKGRAMLYHRTAGSVARRIMEEGFRSGVGTYLTGRTMRGTFLSSRPVDVNEGATGTALIGVEIELARIADRELTEPGQPWREWCVPASILNRYGKRRLMEPGDENEPAKGDNLVPRRKRK
jgi:hypothetical protein